MGYFAGLVIGIFIGVLWSFSNVSGDTLSKLNTSCTTNGGFDKAVVVLARTRVYCKDGAEFKLKD